jgi:hypothetical protein
MSLRKTQVIKVFGAWVMQKHLLAANNLQQDQYTQLDNYLAEKLRSKRTFTRFPFQFYESN